MIAPGWYLDVTRWFMLIGFAGLLPALRMLRVRTEPGLPIVYFALLPWLVTVALSVLYWTSTVDYGEQGRLAHIGASAFGVTMAVGWSALAPNRWRTWCQALLAGFMLALAVVGFVVLRTAFALPPTLATDVDVQRPIAAEFSGGMQVVGIDLPHGAAIEPGASIPLTLYFTADAPITDDYTLFVHLSDENDALLYQFDGVPVRGGHPTRQWRPGEIFADNYEVAVPASSSAGLTTLSIGFYPIGNAAERQPVVDAVGNAIGDRLVLARVRITEPQAASTIAPSVETAQPVGTWHNGIMLGSAVVEYDAASNPQGIVLDWTTNATLNSDYTVFVQVLDAEDRILAQVDSQPHYGKMPTSTWRAGDRIRDVLAWKGDTRTWSRIIVGLYDQQGVRLEVVEPARLPDAVEVATARTGHSNFLGLSLALTPLQCKLIRL